MNFTDYKRNCDGYEWRCMNKICSHYKKKARNPFFSGGGARKTNINSPMKLLELRDLTMTPELTSEFIRKNNLIVDDPLDVNFQRQMHLEKGKTRHGINNRWRCSVSKCRKSMSTFAYSIFENVHMPLNHCLYAL
ncbi:hypothetical protein COBT_000680 [Conglomerata obtusa]